MNGLQTQPGEIVQGAKIDVGIKRRPRFTTHPVGQFWHGHTDAGGHRSIIPMIGIKRLPNPRAIHKALPKQAIKAAGPEKREQKNKSTGERRYRITIDKTTLSNNGEYKKRFSAICHNRLIIVQDNGSHTPDTGAIFVVKHPNLLIPVHENLRPCTLRVLKKSNKTSTKKENIKSIAFIPNWIILSVLKKIHVSKFV